MTATDHRTLTNSSSAHCELRVEGMDCLSCADQIQRSLGALEGVDDVQVDVVGGRVRVRYADDKLARGDLAGAIRRIGYRVQDGEPRRAVFTVDEMDCADEVRQIEDRLGRLPGVTELAFDLMSRRVIVDGSIAAAEIQRVIGELGMTARHEGEHAHEMSFWQRHGRLLMASASGVFLLLGFVLDWAGLADWVTIPLLAVSAVTGAWYVAPRAWRAARHGALDMNFLMMVAAIGAVGIGEWSEAASVVFLFSVAQVLEAHSMDRARHAIKALMELAPTEATVRRDAGEETVPADQVRIGEVIVVRPGQKIPLDGQVIEGRSAVNQASITGESMPVDKHLDDEVFAGSLNEQGLLHIRVTKLVQDTTLARIIHAVEEAQSSRAPSHSLVDRFARVYTPLVVGLAAAIFVIPPLVGFGLWETWFYRALALLVVACPCALVISTPVSLVSGLAGAARQGILIKGGLHLENIGKITTIAFDKTGTLTEGQPRVTDVTPLGGESEASVLRLAAALEHGSTHPIARAILAHAEQQDVELPPASEFTELVGRGIEARVEGRRLALGNARLCRERGANERVAAVLRPLEQQGKTVVTLLDGAEPLGVIAVADRIRDGAPEAMAKLRAAGLQKIIMLTGDNEATARAVAEQLELDEYRAELLPEDKVAVVREHEASGERVGFVGDGVNDAPALAAASVGIAMGAAGTDVALETADMALMTDSLSQLSRGIRMSHKTLGIIKQNIIFSLAVKAIFVVLAVTGWATLWMAVAADMGASLVVIANGLRALRD